MAGYDLATHRLLLTAGRGRRVRRDAVDAADAVRTVLDEAGCRRRRVLHGNRKIEIADRPVDGIAPALDHGVLQWPGELPLQLHPRHLAPFRGLLELLLSRGRSNRSRLRRLLLRKRACRPGGDQRQYGNSPDGSITRHANQFRHSQALSESKPGRHAPRRQFSVIDPPTTPPTLPWLGTPDTDALKRRRLVAA